MNIKKHKEYLQQLLDDYKRRLETLNASKTDTAKELRRRLYCTIRNICENSLRFIDCLIPDCEDLEKAAEDYLKKNWDVDNIYEEDDLDIRKTFKAGAIWQREQMIKNAIETTIVDDWQYGKDQDHTTIPAIHQRIDGCKAGDKVKVLIIKED